MSYEVKKLVDKDGNVLYEVWRLTDGTIGFMNTSQLEEFFNEPADEGHIVMEVEIESVEEYPKPSPDWFYDDDELQDESEWYDGEE